MLNDGTLLANRYRVVRLLGGGGMKQVYLAEDLRLSNRPCALAEMIEAFTNPRDQQAAAQSFAGEAKILAQLKHARIPHIYDHFSEQTHHFLVTEYVEGETLEDTIKASPQGLPESLVVDVALQVLEALEYLHGRTPTVIFRDLKPSNVMIAIDGSVKVIDFGIARLFVPQKTATMVGTQGYAPPEQYEGKAEPRTDLYALGATMLQLLTGWDPSAHTPFSFPPLRQLRRDCSPALEEIISEALMTDLNQRIPNAHEFKRRLCALKAAAYPQSSTRAFAAPAREGSYSSTPDPSALVKILTGHASYNEPTAILAHQVACRRCSRQIPDDAQACPYCMTVLHTGPDRRASWLIAGLAVISLLSLSFGALLFLQRENQVAAPAPTALATSAALPTSHASSFDNSASKHRHKPSSFKSATVTNLAGSSPDTVAIAPPTTAAPRVEQTDLRKYVGTYPFEKFLRLPEIKIPLERVLDGHMEEFKSRFGVLSPIEMVDRDLFASGCREHDCSDNEACFSINVDTGEVVAATLTNGEFIDIYSRTVTNYDELPLAIKRWVMVESAASSASPKQLQLRFVGDLP
jgi:serine/threonine protein kinase